MSLLNAKLLQTIRTIWELFVHTSCTAYAKDDPRETKIKRCKSAIVYKICSMLSAYLHCILHMCQVCGKEQLKLQL